MCPTAASAQASTFNDRPWPGDHGQRLHPPEATPLRLIRVQDHHVVVFPGVDMLRRIRSGFHSGAQDRQ